MKHNKIIATTLVTLASLIINASAAFAMFPGTPSQEPDPKVYNTVVVREFPNNNCECDLHKQTILVRPCYHCQPGGLLKWQESQPEWPGVTPSPGPDAYVSESCSKLAHHQPLDNIRCHMNNVSYSVKISHKRVDAMGQMFN